MGLAAIVPKSLHAKAAQVHVVSLETDYLDRPLGLENPRPQLSWRLESVERGVRQSAYHIMVASSESLLEQGHADLWDSGQVASRKSFGVAYNGRPLRSRERCWWRVQVWDEAGRRCEPSASSWWEMGLSLPKDWTAHWVATEDAIAKADREEPLQWMWLPGAGEDAQPAFRRRFTLTKSTHGGTLHIFTRLPTLGQVTGVWLDGMALGTEIPVRNLSYEQIALPGLSAGEHCLAIAANSKNSQAEAYPDYPGYVVPPLGIAVLARFDAENGPSLRVCSGPEWKSGLASASDWRPLGYDEDSWPAVICAKVEEALLRSPGMHLRRRFAIEQAVVKARLYASALGVYEARLNGHRIGDVWLAPELTLYDEHIQYQVYDVTGQIKRGSNILGFTVGGGWYQYGMWGPPPCRLIAQLELTLADGSQLVIATDPNWRLARNGILESGFRPQFFGEIYDARAEPEGWDTAQFDDAHWGYAELAPLPSGQLKAQTTPPIRAVEVLKPRSIQSPVDGVYVVDFGQNFGGWCRLKATGPRGTRVDLHFSEELTPSGELDEFFLEGGKSSDTYILRGDSAGESFEPRFSHHGFRYVQITGLPAAPTAESITGVAISSDLKVTGRLRIGHPLLQQIWRNTLWTQRSTIWGNPWNLCNRNDIVYEQGDLAVFWETATFNMNVASVTRRYMDDLRDALSPTSVFPRFVLVPKKYNYVETTGPTPAWHDAAIIAPWTQWHQYGDLHIIQQNWAAMDRYLQFVHENNSDYIWKNKNYLTADWEAIGENNLYHPDQPPTTPLDLIGTAYWAYSTGLLAQMAEAICRTQDAIRLRAGYEHIRAAFIRTFVKPDGQIGNSSQTGYVLALQFGLVPEDLRATAAERLVQDIRGRGVALSTGILGTRFIFDVLAEAGYGDLVYSLLLRTEYPSWGDQIALGATTFWERWDGDAQHLYNEGSHNHVMFGSVGGFLYRRIAGIEAASPGFEAIAVRPLLDPRVRRAGGDYDSMMGRISTDWQQHEDGSFSIQLTLPVNATGRIHLPARPGSRIQEGGRELSGRGVRVARRTEKEAIVEVGSGTYHFHVDGL